MNYGLTEVRASWGIFWRLVARAALGTYRDGCLGIAKAVAYSSLLAFFPLLATVAAILVHTRAQFTEQLISSFLASILPPDTEDLVMTSFRASHSVVMPVSAIVLSIWAGSGATTSLMQGFRAAYKIPSGRPFLSDRTMAIVLIFSAALPLIGASWLVFFGRHIEVWITGWLGLIRSSADLRGGLAVMSTAVRYVIAMSAITAGTALLYYYGPNRRQRYRLVLPGALVATVLWFIATDLFAWYVRNMANYSVMYGSIAAVIALVVWMYLLAVIAFIGCEFNREYELHLMSLRPRAKAKRSGSGSR